MSFLAHSDKYALPGGVVGVSSLLDETGSFPSAHIYTGLDWLPCLWKTPFNTKHSELWPPAVPRYDFYSDSPLHPLVFIIIRLGSR
jgi:hypothetical protein